MITLISSKWRVLMFDIDDDDDDNNDDVEDDDNDEIQCSTRITKLRMMIGEIIVPVSLLRTFTIYYSDDDEPMSQLIPEDSAAKKGELNKKSENKHKQTSSLGQINSMSKSLMPYINGKRKSHARKSLISAKDINERLWLKEARNELLAYEAAMNESKLKLELINQEIKPFVEKHDRDARNKVPTSVAESWLDAHCNQMTREFDFFSVVIENVMCNPKKPKDDAMSNGEAGDGVNPLDNDE